MNDILRLALLTTAVFFTGCFVVRGDGVVDSDDYDRSCTTREDCVLVTSGRVCSCRCAPNSAINRSDIDDWNDARDDAGPCPKNSRQVCGDLQPETETIQQASVCAQPVAVCDDAVCNAFDPESDELPNDCVVDDDCVLVPASLHDTCSCTTRAVNQRGLQLGLQVREGLRARNGLYDSDFDEECTCSTQRPTCVEGQCLAPTPSGCIGASWDPTVCESD